MQQAVWGCRDARTFKQRSSDDSRGEWLMWWTQGGCFLIRWPSSVTAPSLDPGLLRDSFSFSNSAWPERSTSSRPQTWRPDRLGTCCSPYDVAPGWRRGGARPERTKSPGSNPPDRRGRRPLCLRGEMSLSSAAMCFKCPGQTGGLTCAQMLVDSGPHLLRLLQLGAVQWGQELCDTQLLPGHPAETQDETKRCFFSVFDVKIYNPSFSFIYGSVFSPFFSAI